MEIRDGPRSIVSTARADLISSLEHDVEAASVEIFDRSRRADGVLLPLGAPDEKQDHHTHTQDKSKDKMEA